MLKGLQLQNAFNEYLVAYSAEKGLEEKTIKNKRHVLNGLIPFLKGKPLTLEACRAYAVYKFEHGWVKPNSRVNIIKNLRAFVNFLFDRGYLDQNFAKKLIKPKVTRQPLNLVSEEEAEKIIIAGTEPGVGDRSRSIRIKAETRLCLMFILRSGLRITEALSLKGSDLSPFDDQPSYYVISKGGNAAQMPLPDDMVDEMKKRTVKTRVFETTDKTCNKNLKDGTKKLGISIETTCHKLRDIYSLSRLRRGNSLQLVSRSLRHTSVAITDKYYSNFVLTDIAPVVNDSPLITKRLSIYQIVEKAIKAFKISIGDDDRIKLKIEQDTYGNATIITKSKTN